MKTTRTLQPVNMDHLIDPETTKRLGEAFAEILEAQMNTPSFMRVVVEHQQAHPNKSPMQCMNDAVPEYNARCREAIDKAASKYRYGDSLITVNSN